MTQYEKYIELYTDVYINGNLEIKNINDFETLLLFHDLEIYYKPIIITKKTACKEVQIKEIEKNFIIKLALIRLRYLIDFVSKEYKNEYILYKFNLILMFKHLILKELETFKLSYIDSYFLSIIKCIYKTFEKTNHEDEKNIDFKIEFFKIITIIITNLILGYDMTGDNYVLCGIHITNIKEKIFKVLKKFDYVILSINDPDYNPKISENFII